MAVIHRLVTPTSPLGWTFGDRLRKVRRVEGLTQKGLALQLGVSSNSVDAWESDRNLPRDLLDQATHIEETFGLPRGWMLGYADGPDGETSNGVTRKYPDEGAVIIPFPLPLAA